jgi:predicted ribosome quality control (RQC) complex YloA/Tae2 family protein
VVVRNPTGGEVPRDVIERAGQLAAWYSKARGAPRVEVHTCRVADVSKSRGAPRGQVEIKRFKRIKVQPSPLDTEGE